MSPESHALITQQFHYIESLRIHPMSGLDYCCKWVPVFYGVHPGESLFKSKCLAELSRVTGAQINTIRANWGSTFENMPTYAGTLLRTTDLLNQMIVGLQLPPQFPK